MKQQHTRIISTVFAAGGLLAVGASGAVAAPADTPDTQGVICHATGDGYERVNIPLKEIVNDHVGHGDDIIPSFEYTEQGEGYSFDGQNYDGEGRDIWNNGCNDPNEEQTGDDETGDDQGDDAEEEAPPAEGEGDDAEAQAPEVVQTDGTVAEDNSMLAALGIGMLFAGGATLVAVGAGVTGSRD